MFHNGSLYERLIFASLAGMNKGRLTVHLPDGRLRVLGGTAEGPTAGMRIHHERFFSRCFWQGDIGFGESYVDGDWETDDLAALMHWMIVNIENNPAMSGSRRRFSPLNALQALNRLLHRLRPNSLSGSRKNIEAHYDLSNEFFKTFLDATMTYSSAYFLKPEDSLEQAQRQKYDALCRKLKLQPGEHVLEIGCGWGGFAEYAAKTYGVRVTGITISQEQYRFAQERIARAGLSDQVTIRLQDYRHLEGQYDKIVSIEMLEAVGHEYLEPYFASVQRVLAPHGAVGLQVITCADSRYDALRKGVDWIQKHIFPGSLLPSITAIQMAINNTGGMVLQHVENMAPHYARTLETWKTNFAAGREQIHALGFDETFRRKWTYYFNYCQAAFATRNIGVHQMIFTRPNNPHF